MENHFTPTHLIPPKYTFTDPAVTWFVAEVENKVIGVSSYKKLSSTSVEAQKTIVAKPYRGRGYGWEFALAMENTKYN